MAKVKREKVWNTSIRSQQDGGILVALGEDNETVGQQEETEHGTANVAKVGLEA